MPENKSFPAFARGMVLAFAVLLAGCATPPPGGNFSPTAVEVQLVDLMARRLEIARHVAWVKFQNGLPVSDPKREAELLSSLVQQGSRLGVPAGDVEIFFNAQIRASCRVQEELIRSWRRGATLPAFAPWDLRRHIRPKLDEISAGMLVSLKVQPAANRPEFAAYAETGLRQRGFSWSVARTATAPLR